MNIGVAWRLFSFKVMPWKHIRLREMCLLLLSMNGQCVISALVDASFAPANAAIENSSCQCYVKVRNSLCDLSAC